jgi:DNA invertase Pin-like site-specific DNA recombinase
VHDLTERDIGLRVLTGQGAAIDTTTAAGKLVFGIFAALAEFERELIRERTIAGLAPLERADASRRRRRRSFAWLPRPWVRKAPRSSPAACANARMISAYREWRPGRGTTILENQ